MTIDASAFNFDAMKEAVGADPFAKDTGNRYARDERFYMLSKDKEGNGAALIRFLPDSENGIIQKMFKVNTTIVMNGKKRFCNEYSPTTVGLPDPFQERWQELWNAGNKEESKLYSRATRFVTNIKVLKDPANPENEGKYFLYEMSGAMKDKIQNAVNPSEQDRALGATPKELFNPIQGNSFRLVAKKGANGQINYDSSEVINEVNGIYTTVEEAFADIKENTHKLSDLLKPEFFMSYEDLLQKMNWVTFTDQEAVTTLKTEVATPSVEVAEVQPAEAKPVAEVTVAETPVETEKTPGANTSLDDLLKNL